MPFPFLAAAGALSSVIGSIFKGSQAKKQQRMADKIHPINAVYNTSPYAENQLSTVQQMMNGRMAGAGSEEQNIQGNFANSMAGVNRNSTNGSQSLAMLAGLQGNTNQAFSDLQTKENMNKQSLLGQLAYANQGMTQEGDKMYNDKLRNYNNDMNAKNALQNASWQNKGSMWSGIGNALIGGANVASQGGFKGIFGGGGSGSGLSNSTQAMQGSGIPNYGMGYGTPNGGGYIDPNMPNLQRNYSNPFIH